MTKQSKYYIYILTNKNNNVLYTGVTRNLVKRVYQHRHSSQGFTKKYNVYKLVYFEVFSDPENAIKHEKQIKAGSRRKKTDLVETMNPKWKDLYGEIATG